MVSPGARWRSGYASVCKTEYTGSIPVLASTLLSRQVALKPGFPCAWGTTCLWRGSARVCYKAPALSAELRAAVGNAVLLPR